MAPELAKPMWHFRSGLRRNVPASAGSALTICLDANYGLTCRVCNRRDGGCYYIPSVKATVMTGYTKAPWQSSSYCLEHSKTASALWIREMEQRRRQQLEQCIPLFPQMNDAGFAMEALGPERSKRRRIEKLYQRARVAKEGLS